MIGKFVQPKNMNAIQYQVLRYLPDRVTGEFVNLGKGTLGITSRDVAKDLYERIVRRYIID